MYGVQSSSSSSFAPRRGERGFAPPRRRSDPAKKLVDRFVCRSENCGSQSAHRGFQPCRWAPLSEDPMAVWAEDGQFWFCRYRLIGRLEDCVPDELGFGHAGSHSGAGKDLTLGSVELRGFRFRSHVAQVNRTWQPIECQESTNSDLTRRPDCDRRAREAQGPSLMRMCSTLLRRDSTLALLNRSPGRGWPPRELRADALAGASRPVSSPPDADAHRGPSAAQLAAEAVQSDRASRADLCAAARRGSRVHSVR